MTYTNEDKLQAECWVWSWNYRPETRRCIWHTPNGGKRIQKEAAKFKAMGVLAGVCDMHFIWRSQLYIIELKVCSNHITDAQEQYIRAATRQGAIFYECRSMEKWQLIVNSILNNNALPCEAHMLTKRGNNIWYVLHAA
jgi:hypothetical protein